MKHKVELQDEWAAIERRPPAAPGVFDRAAAAVCLVNGAAFLSGYVQWYHGSAADQQFTLIYGAVFTAIGGFELLRYWWRRR